MRETEQIEFRENQSNCSSPAAVVVMLVRIAIDSDTHANPIIIIFLSQLNYIKSRNRELMLYEHYDD